MKKIVITGGGTGGHAIPCLAVGETLKNDYEIHFVGSTNGIEKELVKNYSYIIYHEITTCKLIRAITFENCKIPFKLYKGYKESLKILKELSPIAIFSKGGYVSVPIVFAASKLKIPIISHESDYSLGLANKLNCKKSKYMCCSFSNLAKKLKNGVYTGSPIRKQIMFGNKENLKQKHNLDTFKKSILILGGSLGSKNLNNLVRKKLDILTKNFNVFHICGKNNLTFCKERYFQMEYVDNIQDYYDIADIVVSRSGSNVIFELLALKKPMILVPLEKNSRGDQIENAKFFESKGFAKILRESDFEKEFENVLSDVLNNKDLIIEKIENEKLNAVSKICELLTSFDIN